MPKVESLIIIVNGISEWSGNIVKWLMIPITIIVFMEVVLRYVFNSPTTWVYEMTGFLFGTLSLIGGAYCMRFDLHVRMSLIRDRISPRRRAIVDICSSMLIFIFCLALLWKGSTFAWQSVSLLERTNTVWNPPYWPFTLMLPLSALLLMLQLLATLADNVIILIKGRGVI